MAPLPMWSIKSLIQEVDFEGQGFISINSMTNDQLLTLSEFERNLEPQNRGSRQLYPDAIVSLLFFQPSTRTRMSFETMTYRMGGNAIAENTPQTTSSTAKEESLADMLRCASQYVNVIVSCHPSDVDARKSALYSSTPVINGGWGHWEHLTQVLLDLHTLRHKFGHIEGLKVATAAVDMTEACTGHSMAQGLARLGTEVTITSSKDKAVPHEVIENAKKNHPDVRPEEACDFEKDSFNEFIRGKDLVYLPGCSAPAGATAEVFKEVMDDHSVKHETLDEEREKGHTIYVTHMLPRRAGEIDLTVDDTPNQLCFESILHSVSIRVTPLTAILGA